MAIQTLYDVGSTYQVTPKIDGGVFGTGISDCVCKGIGGQFSITTSQSSLDVTISAGSMAIIGGGYFKLTGNSAVTVTLNASSTIYLCANIDLSKPNGSRGSFVQRTASNMESGNLNGSGTSRDLLLYVITTNAQGVTNVDDRRVIKGDGGATIGDLNQDNLELISNLTLNQTYMQQINNGAVPVRTSAPTSAYSGGGARIVYLTSAPATKYSGYIYLIKESS